MAVVNQAHAGVGLGPSGLPSARLRAPLACSPRRMGVVTYFVRCNVSTVTKHKITLQLIWWSMKSVTSSTENAVLGKAFIRAGEGLGLDDADLAAVLDEHVSNVLLLRRGHELLQPGTEAWSRALLLVELYQSLLAVAGNEQNAKIWLSSENRGLSSRPRDLITCRAGLEQVVQYLAATRSLI